MTPSRSRPTTAGPSGEQAEGSPVGLFEWILFLVLMMGVGLGSAAAAWATRLSEQERQWIEAGKDAMTPKTEARPAPA